LGTPASSQIQRDCAGLLPPTKGISPTEFKTEKIITQTKNARKKSALKNPCEFLISVSFISNQLTGHFRSDLSPPILLQVAGQYSYSCSSSFSPFKRFKNEYE
jgi:hypothetical protein